MCVGEPDFSVLISPIQPFSGSQVYYQWLSQEWLNKGVPIVLPEAEIQLYTSGEVMVGHSALPVSGVSPWGQSLSGQSLSGTRKR